MQLPLCNAASKKPVFLDQRAGNLLEKNRFVLFGSQWSILKVYLVWTSCGMNNRVFLSFSPFLFDYLIRSHVVVLNLGVYFWHGRSCSWWQNMRRFVLGHLSANGEFMVVWTPNSDSAPIALFLCPAVLTVWIPRLLIIPVVQRRNEYACLCLIRFIQSLMDANHAGSKLSSALFPG